MITPAPAYAEKPVGGPLEELIGEGISIAPLAKLDLDRLVDELLREGVLTSPLKDGLQEQLLGLSSSPKNNDPCYGFRRGTGQLCTNYAQGHHYQVGDSFTLSISTNIDAYFVLFKWQNGRWSWFLIGWVPGPGGRNFTENVQAPSPATVVLVAVNLLNWDYGWYWYEVM